MSVRKRVATLRQLMKKHGLKAYYVPSTDPHQSEYVPECWQRRRFLSGFSGSAGNVLVTADHAGLWTDGRYFLQAETELKGSGIKLFKMGMPGVPSLEEFLVKAVGAGDKVGVDPRLISMQQAEDLEDELDDVDASLEYVDENLVDSVWADQPARPASLAFGLARKFAGETTASKLRRLRAEMKKHGAQAHVLTTLDAIAWLFNIRGTDVEFNPVVIAYAIVTADRATLFVDERKVPPKLIRSLGKVDVRPYNSVADALAKLEKDKARVWIDAETVNQWIVSVLGDAELVVGASPVGTMKARKNPTEMDGMRECHRRDGVAMVRWMHWLEGAMNKSGLTEISAADQLAEFRAQGDHFQGLSFGTISGYGAHGAIIHYSADEQSNAKLQRRGIYLVDSGAQYLDGTTDITRTLLMGKSATREQKDRFTRVLKGHIALARAKFPRGVRGLRLDTLARLPLWEAGLDYNHGTGHGVGSFLNVHEGPQAISARCTGVALEPGNVQSNEPGFYLDGEYGIRIESLLLVNEDPQLANGFLCFETLTLCPIERRLVDTKLLTDAERRWFNEYHRRVKRELGPRLSRPERAWLTAACAPL